VTTSMLGASFGALAGLGLLLVARGLPVRRRPTLEQRVAPYLRDTAAPSRLLTAGPPAGGRLGQLGRRLADRLELHYTPKHGSWLNMAEIELAVLSEQCLDRRLADRATLEREVAAWQMDTETTFGNIDRGSENPFAVDDDAYGN